MKTILFLISITTSTVMLINKGVETMSTPICIHKEHISDVDMEIQRATKTRCNKPQGRKAWGV